MRLAGLGAAERALEPSSSLQPRGHRGQTKLRNLDGYQKPPNIGKAARKHAPSSATTRAA